MKRVYIAGAGFIGKKYAQAAGTLPADVRLKAADPNPNALDSFGEEFPGSELYADVERMLEEEPRDSDIVVIGTPPFARRDLAISGLESGRHVLCEKPFAIDRSEAMEILDAARTNDRLVGTATARYLGVPHTEAVRELLREGALGRPYHVTFIDRKPRSRTGIEYQPESKWPLDRSKAGGGILMNWGTYDFAILNHVLEPHRVTVTDAWTEIPETDHDLPDDVTNDVEQHAGASIHYHRDDCRINVRYERADCIHGEPGSHFQIEGTNAAVKWNWKDFRAPMSLTFMYDDGNEPRQEKRTFESDNELGPGAKPLIYFDRRIRGESAPIPLNENAVFNHACIRGVYEVAENGRSTTIELSEI